MGKGILMPDTRTLQDCEVPVFKTHPTPINVSVRPESSDADKSKYGSEKKRGGSLLGSPRNNQTGQRCACIIS